MKTLGKVKKKAISLNQVIEGAGSYARKLSFKKDMPVAISKNGNIVLVYPDDHTEIISSSEKIEALLPSKLKS